MGYAIGLAPDEQGNGTTPADMQQWIWSLYRTSTAQIARGLVVSGRSSMSYAFTGGVIIVPTGDQACIAVPVAAGNVVTPEAPTTGSRTDYIYVGRDGAVMVGTSQPGGTALLDKRTVPAGVTATTATTSLLGDRKYAPLYGSSMGQIARWEQKIADLTKVTNSRTLVADKTFTLESDRRCEIILEVTYEMLRDANSSTDLGKISSYKWEFILDGDTIRGVELGVETYAETKQHRFYWDIPAGTHTLQLYRERRIIGVTDEKKDYPILRNGSIDRWPPSSLTIFDMGGIE